MKFPRVLAESEDFFAGLQHPDSPVQIRSAPLVRIGRNAEKQCFSLFCVFERHDRLEYAISSFCECLPNCCLSLLNGDSSARAIRKVAPAC